MLVGELELAVDRGAGVLAVDVHPAHALVHGAQVELGAAARSTARRSPTTLRPVAPTLSNAVAEGASSIRRSHR